MLAHARGACAAALTLLALLLAPAGASAADPADHLPLLPPGTVDTVAIDLTGETTAAQRQAALLYLERDAGFSTLRGWLERARLARGIESVLMVADGIGQSAFFIELAAPSDIEKETWKAMLRAGGLSEVARRGGPALWTGPGGGEGEASAPPYPFAVLQMSDELVVGGHEAVVEQIAGRVGARRPGAPGPMQRHLGQPPPSSQLWFATLTPGAPPGEPVATFGHVHIDAGALIEVRFGLRSPEDALAFQKNARAWLTSDTRRAELAWLGVGPKTLDRAIVSSVGDRVHVVLTLTSDEAARTLESAVDTLRTPPAP